MRYVALLRGINVGGKNKIKMAELKRALEAINLCNVSTYLQSGNIFFDFEIMNTMILADKIEKIIEDAFGFAVKTIIRTEGEFRDIVGSNLLEKGRDIESDKLHVTFMRETPEPSAVSGLAVKKEANEKLLIASREIYLYCPNGYGNTKLSNSMFEKKLKISATTRNWKTINKLLEMMTPVIQEPALDK
jgi:uncharacterized protein (DUF1697 family)